jgi:hypothetical protein
MVREDAEFSALEHEEKVADGLVDCQQLSVVS